MLTEKDQADLLWKVYQEHYTNARHHETQRATMVQYLLITGGLIGTLAAYEGVTAADRPLAVFLMVLGLFGAVFSASHYERYHRHKQRANKYRDLLDELVFPGSPTLARLKDMADEERIREHPWLDRAVSVHWLWLGFPLLVSVLGLVLLWMATR